MAIQDFLPLGSEDVINPEELEDTEEEAWETELRYDELLTREETIETKELSPELLKAEDEEITKIIW